MAGHLECIGIEGEEELLEAVDAAVAQGDDIGFDGGREVVWRDAEGASLAVSITADDEIYCVRPSFATTTRIDARLESLAEDPECRFCSRLLLEVVDETGDLAYPLAVELERHAPARRAPLERRRSQVAVTAFAETLEVWPSEDAYYAADPGRILDDGSVEGDPALAAQSLIPVGLFVEEEPKSRLWRRRGAEPVPTAHALMTGLVREHGRRRNSVTSREFAWANVESYGATYAVVCTADNATGLREDAVVQGNFWLIAALPE